MTRLTLTYGVLPTWEQFLDAYRAELGDETMMYAITMGAISHEAMDNAAGNYDANTLWRLVQEYSAKGDIGEDDGYMALAADILETLGIEWV